MSSDHYNLDEVDRGILHLLQQDARGNTAREIGDAVGVSPGTVRNRVEKLEAAGVIRGYHPEIDYGEAGYPLHVLFTCIAEEPSESLAEAVLERHGVVSVKKLLAGEENYHVEAIGTSTNDVSTIANGIRECGLEVVRSEVIDEAFAQPFNHFGQTVVDDGD